VHIAHSTKGEQKKYRKRGGGGGGGGGSQSINFKSKVYMHDCAV
jgi:hypothetical protein